MKKTKALVLTFVFLAVVVVVLNVLLFAAHKPEKTSETKYFYSEADYNGYLTEHGFENGKSDKKFVSAAVQKVGEQTREGTRYFLYLDLRVTFDTAASVYQIEANARWDKKSSYAGIQTAEGTALDFLAITWGGGFCADAKDMFGKYYGSGNTAEFSRCESNSYGAFVWQFHERNGLYGDILEYGAARVTLAPVEANGATELTGVNLTYIHTAHKADYGMMSIDYARRVPHVNYRTIRSSWQTVLSVDF